MKILFFGDVFGRSGREALQIKYKELVDKHKPDFVIANIENIAHGRGINMRSIQEIEEGGNVFHCYTSGNHHFANAGVYDVIKESSIPLIRPINYPIIKDGVGYRIIESGAKRMLVICALGRIFMKESENIENPFLMIDNILEKYTMDKDEEGKELVDGILVDFHTETTAEKRTMGFFLDGRVSVVLGTHTHVPTRDDQILQGGTAYMSDVGMVGPFNSSLGLDKDCIIEEMLTEKRGKRDVSEERTVEMGAVSIKVDDNGLSSDIEHIRLMVEL